MTPLKYGLVYVGLAMAVAVGDALLRAIGRRSSLLTWPAVGCLGYGAAVLVFRPAAVWWSAMLAVVVLAIPLGAAVTVLRAAYLRVGDGETPVDPAAALRADLELRVHELAAQLQSGGMTADEWRAAISGLAHEVAAT